MSSYFCGFKAESGDEVKVDCIDITNRRIYSDVFEKKSFLHHRPMICSTNGGDIFYKLNTDIHTILELKSLHTIMKILRIKSAAFSYIIFDRDSPWRSLDFFGDYNYTRKDIRTKFQELSTISGQRPDIYDMETEKYKDIITKGGISDNNYNAAFVAICGEKK